MGVQYLRIAKERMLHLHLNQIAGVMRMLTRLLQLLVYVKDVICGYKKGMRKIGRMSLCKLYKLYLFKNKQGKERFLHSGMLLANDKFNMP